MRDDHAKILEAANTAIAEGDYERYLTFVADDSEWEFVGDRTLEGKDAVRAWLAESYLEPPRNTVTDLIAEGEFLTAIGEIETTDPDGTSVRSAYCDVWRFRDGLMSALRAFVIRLTP